MRAAIKRTSELACAPDEAWSHALSGRLLDHVAAPLIRFAPKGGGSFPQHWQPGEYRAWMFLFGFIPLGWQAIVISLPEPRGELRFIRDNGYSPLIKRWDHWIEIAPGPDGTTCYTDRVTIEAGVLTGLIAAFARLFYAHRQRRWRALARTRFAALER